jgi:DNA-directed RNA polymerase subunit RPC12/RpoP
MSVYICAYCGVSVSKNQAFQAHKGALPVFLHRGCHETVSALNGLAKRIAALEANAKPRPMLIQKDPPEVVKPLCDHRYATALVPDGRVVCANCGEEIKDLKATVEQVNT